MIRSVKLSKNVYRQASEGTSRLLRVTNNPCRQKAEVDSDTLAECSSRGSIDNKVFGESCCSIHKR